MGEERTLTKALGSFAWSLWEEARPILKHGFITTLALLIIAILNWLFDRLIPTEFGEYLHKIEKVLYFILFILFGISTITQLLMSFVVHTTEKIAAMRLQDFRALSPVKVTENTLEAVRPRIAAELGSKESNDDYKN